MSEKIIEILNSNIVKVYEIDGIEIKEIKKPIRNKKKVLSEIDGQKASEFIVYAINSKYTNSSSFSSIADFWSKTSVNISRGNIVIEDVENLLRNSIIDVFYIDDLLKRLPENETEIVNNLKALAVKNFRSPELEIISNFILNVNSCIPETLEKMIEIKTANFGNKTTESIDIDINIDIKTAKKRLLYLSKKIDLDKYLSRFKTKNEEDIIKEVNLKTIVDIKSFNSFKKNDMKNIFFLDESKRKKTFDSSSIIEIIESSFDNIIFGEQKYGKTTLSLLFLLEAKKLNLYPIYIDLALDNYSLEEIKEKITDNSNFIVFDNFDKLEDKESFQQKILIFHEIDAKIVIFSLPIEGLQEKLKKAYFNSFNILKPEISIKWIKNYEDLYFYNQSKDKSNDYYTFVHLYLMDNLLKPKMKKFKEKYKLTFFEDSRVQKLLSNIAINLISEKSKTLTSMNSFLQEGDENFINTIPEIIKVNTIYKQIEFETELFRDFFVALYLRATNKLDFLMKEHNNFKDYKWRNSLLLLSDFIVEIKERKFLDNSDFMESILKHLNSEKDIEKMKKIINLTKNSNSITLKLYSAKILSRIGKYSDSIKLTLDLILLSDENKWSLLIDLFNNLISSLSTITLYDLALYISENFLEVVKTYYKTLKSTEKEFLELEKFIVRFGGSFARILLLKDPNNFDRAKILFEEKFNFTKDRIGFENEHLRNSSDMIYLDFFEYKKSKNNDIIIKTINSLDFLNKQYLEKYSIDEFDFNFLFINTNVSYFITENLEKKNEEKLLDIITKIEEKYTHFQSNIKKEEYKLPLGLIQYNLGKYYHIKKEKDISINYFKKALENFSEYKTPSYYVNLYLNFLTNDTIYISQAKEIYNKIEEEKNTILELFNNNKIINKLNTILNTNLELKDYNSFSFHKIEDITETSLNTIIF
ncbi:MAG: hypothetical protein AABZ74_08945 [Cyanobacteriota bacterium]